MTAQSTLTTPAPAYGVQLTLIAFIRAKPGLGDELGRRLGALVEPSRAEAGNINYDLHRSNDDPDVWVLYENWKAEADLTLHFEQPYMKAFVAALPEVLEGEMDLRRCSMVTNIAG
ncbi:antibiotic biosynthesis monooxygenase [Luteibacter aegosomatis]|jgi:quinol monooxygenase YgiN|uniref:putative quinol monooxygenase n=1 Tax=Luteibacter aegosomatis TaxID=2911537 RepID=UPI000E2ABDA3|nr:putative quinol monooxygenase [Luteibacter aegosomatis]UPG87261.1 antibiotic biosynthesis monooxygenase [Luteibacter aegosomatis]SVK37477.1 antibiotic biosynthesis monooxygenase [Acinetobacter baumannii]